MKLRERVKQRIKNEGPDAGLSKHWYSLNEEHVLGPARNVNVSALRMHLLLEHGISVSGLKTASDYGKAHLLAHAVLAHPDLRVCLGLPESWGK